MDTRTRNVVAASGSTWGASRAQVVGRPRGAPTVLPWPGSGRNPSAAMQSGRAGAPADPAAVPWGAAVRWPSEGERLAHSNA
jgi:hypothetical protein